MNKKEREQKGNNWRELIGWDEVCMRASMPFQ